MQAATVLMSLARLGKLAAIGPESTTWWPFSEQPENVRWLPPVQNGRRVRFRAGNARYRQDCDFGLKAFQRVHSLPISGCYGFTQISLETAAWCREEGIPFFLDSPNGHIRNFRAVYQRESWRWCYFPYWGHPSREMVARVEAEYSLATRIRVSSRFAKDSIVRGGVPAAKVDIIPQFINLEKFRKIDPAGRSKLEGPLRVCFVGSLDLRKGFVYLLRAIRKLGARKIDLRIVGNTGDPWSKRLFLQERKGLNVTVAPGNPVDALSWAELFVLPSLEDGFGFVVAEAMAASLPVIVFDQCGAAEWVEHGVNGWVIPTEQAAHSDRHVHQAEALAQYLEVALDNRKNLLEMGNEARQVAERRATAENSRALAHWFQRNTCCADFPAFQVI